MPGAVALVVGDGAERRVEGFSERAELRPGSAEVPHRRIQGDRRDCHRALAFGSQGWGSRSPEVRDGKGFVGRHGAGLSDSWEPGERLRGADGLTAQRSAALLQQCASQVCWLVATGHRRHASSPQITDGEHVGTGGVGARGQQQRHMLDLEPRVSTLPLDLRHRLGGLEVAALRDSLVESHKARLGLGIDGSNQVGERPWDIHCDLRVRQRHGLTIHEALAAPGPAAGLGARELAERPTLRGLGPGLHPIPRAEHDAFAARQGLGRPKHVSRARRGGRELIRDVDEDGALPRHSAQARVHQPRHIHAQHLATRGAHVLAQIDRDRHVLHCVAHDRRRRRNLDPAQTLDLLVLRHRDAAKGPRKVAVPH